MSTIDSIKNALFSSLGKKPKNEDLVIPVDGYAEDEEDRNKKRFYGFKINNIRLLLDTNVRSEVINHADVTPIPLMPKCIKGLCNVRGNLVPVYDLYEKFGLNKAASTIDNKKILVLDEKQDMAAIEIDEMITTLEFDEKDMQKDVMTENEIINKLITYCYKENGNNWFGFDHKQMFQIVE